MNKEITELHKTILKLNNLCRRMINKKQIYDPVVSKYVYWFLTGLLNISSFIVYISDYIEKTNGIKITEEEFELAKKTKSFFYTLLLAYKNLNIEKARNFFEEREKLFDDVLEVLREKNPVITHYLLEILKEMSSIGNLIIILKVNEKKPTES
jgi:hypothetical protein